MLISGYALTQVEWSPGPRSSGAFAGTCERRPFGFEDIPHFPLQHSPGTNEFVGETSSGVRVP